MQRHPHDLNRLVNVIIVEGLFSPELMTKWTELEDELSFEMQSNSDKYIRVSSTITPSPFVTFGTNSSKLQCRQALPPEDTKRIEEIVREATTFLFQKIDAAIIDVMSEVKDCLANPAAKKRRLSLGTQNESRRFDDCNINNTDDDVVFKLPINPDTTLPYDVPDSVVSQASRKNIPFSHHSDSTPNRHDLCDNSHPNQFHGDLLRVSTICFSDSDNKVVYFRHGVPKSNDFGQNVFCDHWGYFSRNKNGNQMFVKNNGRKGIAIGGSSHLHVQLFGSQGALHHFITPIKRDCVRFVHSCRHLTRFNLESEAMKAKRNELYHGAAVKRIPNTCYRTSNVCSFFENKIVIPTSQDQEDRNETPALARNVIGLASYTNGDFEEEEIRSRGCIVGMMASDKAFDICVRQEIVDELTNERTTMVIKNHVHRHRDGGGRMTTNVLVGYPVIQTQNGFRRIASGETLPRDDIERLMGIKTTKHKSEVYARHRMDFFILRSIAKNDTSLAVNLKAALSGRKLVPLIIRGVGGCLTLSGSHPLPTHDKRATRLAPTHSIPISQQLTNNFMFDIADAFRRNQCINICFGKDEVTYIGLFRIVVVEWKALGRNELLEKMTELENELKAWQTECDDNPDKYTSSIKEMLKFTPTDKMLLASMGTLGSFIRLEPVDQDQPSITAEEDLKWNVAMVEETNLQKPVLAISREKANKMWEPGEDMDFHTISSFLAHVRKHSQFGFITERGKAQMDILEGGTCKEDDCGQQFEKIPSKLGSVETLFNASVHAAFFGRERACDHSCLQADSIVPPRSFLDSFELLQNKKLRKANKPLLTRPLHPTHLSDVDAGVLLAQISTESYNEIKGQSSGGEEYLNMETTRAEAWDTIFQCIICSLFNPSSLLELTNGQRAPRPRSGEADKFIATLQSYEWAARLIHPIFRNMFYGIKDVVDFIRLLLSLEIKLFVLVPSRQYPHRPKRSDVLHSAVTVLQHRANLSFSEFQMHVFMRTIECCIDSPFGAIDTVYFGYGSESAAKCFLPEMRKANQDRDRVDDHQLVKVVEWILTAFNEKVRKAIECDDPYIQEELKVLQLKWNKGGRNSSGYLVHPNGKKFDISDIEHSLCFYYGLHQQILPSRNMSSSVSMDGAKYLPIRFLSSDRKTAAELPLFEGFISKQDEIRTAYRNLITNEAYKNQHLSKQFKIDIDQDELEQEGIIQTEADTLQITQC